MISYPAVSVVTISYRDPAGLRRTIESCAALIYDGPIEHIVIDGGSGPDVEAYLSGLGDDLAYWQSVSDEGRYDAMNIGASHARGDLVWFMHSGDAFADQSSLQTAVKNMVALGVPVTDHWGYGAALRVDSQGGDLGVWSSSPFRLNRFAAGVAPIPHQAAFFGADLFRTVRGYDEHFGLGADQLMMLRCARIRTPAVVEDVVCLFDTTGAGSTRSMTEHFRDVRAGLETTGYWPFRSKLAGLVYVAWCEAVARTKLSIRTALGHAPGR